MKICQGINYNKRWLHMQLDLIKKQYKYNSECITYNLSEEELKKYNKKGRVSIQNDNRRKRINIYN